MALWMLGTRLAGAAGARMASGGAKLFGASANTAARAGAAAKGLTYKGVAAYGLGEGVHYAMQPLREQHDIYRAVNRSRKEDPGFDQAAMDSIAPAVEEQKQELIANGTINPSNQQQVDRYTQKLTSTALGQMAFSGTPPVQMWQSKEFASLPVEQQKALFNHYVRSRIRVQNTERGGRVIGGALLSLKDWAKNSISPGSVLNDNYARDPELRANVSALMSSASPELIMSMVADVDKQSPRSDGKAPSMLRRDAETIVANRFATDPNFGAQLAMLAQTKQGDALAQNPEMLRSIVNNVSKVGAENWVKGLSSENFLQLASACMSSSGGKSLLTGLGPQGAQLQQTLIDGTKKAAFSKWLSDPLNTHRYAALWLRSKGLQSLGTKVDESPGLFYGGLAALLLGGGFMVRSMFSGNQPNQPQQTQPRQEQPVLTPERIPYTPTYNYRVPEIDYRRYSMPIQNRNEGIIWLNR